MISVMKMVRFKCALHTYIMPEIVSIKDEEKLQQADRTKLTTITNMFVLFFDATELLAFLPGEGPEVMSL